MALTCVSLVANTARHPSCDYMLSMYLFERNVYSSLSPVFYWDCDLVEFREFFTYFGYKSFVRYEIRNKFSVGQWLITSFLEEDLLKSKCFSFLGSLIYPFAFYMDHTCTVMSTTSA